MRDAHSMFQAFPSAAGSSELLISDTVERWGPLAASAEPLRMSRISSIRSFKVVLSPSPEDHSPLLLKCCRCSNSDSSKARSQIHEPLSVSIIRWCERTSSPAPSPGHPPVQVLIEKTHCVGHAQRNFTSTIFSSIVSSAARQYPSAHHGRLQWNPRSPLPDGVQCLGPAAALVAHMMSA